MHSQSVLSEKSTLEASFPAFQEHAAAVLQHFAPGGEIQGDEYVSLNPRLADSNLGSFKINLRTGAWSDFATGDKGGDFISYIAHCLGVTPQESLAPIQEVIDSLPARDAGTTASKAKQKPYKSPWQPVMPVPDDAPPPAGIRPQIERDGDHLSIP